MIEGLSTLDEIVELKRLSGREGRLAPAVVEESTLSSFDASLNVEYIIQPIRATESTMSLYCFEINPNKDAVAFALFLRTQANAPLVIAAMRLQIRLLARSSKSE